MHPDAQLAQAWTLEPSSLTPSVPLQDGGFIAEIDGGLRADAGDVQLQLMNGEVVISCWPPADIAAPVELATAPSLATRSGGALRWSDT